MQWYNKTLVYPTYKHISISYWLSLSYPICLFSPPMVPYWVTQRGYTNSNNYAVINVKMKIKINATKTQNKSSLKLNL